MLETNTRMAGILGSIDWAELIGSKLPFGLQAIRDLGLDLRGDLLFFRKFAVRVRPLNPAVDKDLTGLECNINDLCLNDYVQASPEEMLTAGLRLAQVTIAQSEERRAGPIRIIIAANEGVWTFRFHRIRQGEDWLSRPIDGYKSEAVLSLDSKDIDSWVGLADSR
jgi:hypothetical protein